jgi:hypothetical protein
MNLVERWFSALTTKKLQRSAHRNLKEIAADIRAWAEDWNTDPKPFVWGTRPPSRSWNVWPATAPPQREHHEMTRNILRSFSLPGH